MSKKKLIKVLGSLKPWELKAPLVAATIKVFGTTCTLKFPFIFV